MSFTKIHITELNEFLVNAIIKNKTPVEAEFKEFTAEGFINIEVRGSKKNFDNSSIDFDLQSCECSGLNEYDEISEYLGKTVNTSSVYEFVEFVTSFTSNSQMLINVEEGCWVIRLMDFS